MVAGGGGYYGGNTNGCQQMQYYVGLGANGGSKRICNNTKILLR